MDMDLGRLAAAVATGAGATALMDLWNLFLKRAFGVRSLDYCLLGRWVRSMPGTFRHESIAASPAKAFECQAGWAAHYGIGVSLAVAFVLLSGPWLAAPTLPPALLFGVVTVLFPYAVLQPALGLGVASSRTPRPAQARLKSLATHAVFGAGLWLCALALSLLPRA
jgi:hypothetical protein